MQENLSLVFFRSGMAQSICVATEGTQKTEISDIESRDMIHIHALPIMSLVCKCANTQGDLSL